MSNYIPHFYMDVIIYPYPKPDAGSADLIGIGCPRWRKIQFHIVASLQWFPSSRHSSICWCPFEPIYQGELMIGVAVTCVTVYNIAIMWLRTVDTLHCWPQHWWLSANNGCEGLTTIAERLTELHLGPMKITLLILSFHNSLASGKFEWNFE